MQRRENVAANPSSEASSFPLVDFISKWRLRDRRGQTAPAIEAAEAVATSEAAVNNQEPLLSRLAGTGKDTKIIRLDLTNRLNVANLTTYFKLSIKNFYSYFLL